MRYVIAAALAVLVIPSQVAAQSTNVMEDRGNEFTRTEWDRTSGMNIRMIVYNSGKELRDAARDAHIGAGNIVRNMKAFSQMPLNPNGVCTIHILNPKTNDVKTDLGHEIMHCAYGRWHI